MKRLRLITMLAVFAGLSTAPPAGFADPEDYNMVRVPEQADVLKTLKADHPRLLIDAQGVEQIRKLIETDKKAGDYYAAIKKRADKLFDQPAVTYSIPDGRRLLQTSRTVVERVYNLGMCFLVDGDRKYLDRAWLDLEAAANFPDWNPSHFLDTGEMAAAFGIAYDWFYHELTNAQRKAIRDAIITHGLKPGITAYRSTEHKRWWTVSEHNWNQVCNGGLLTAALAIGDEQPQIAREVVWHAATKLPLAMQTFSPDGGWYEGPGYWGYAMRYNVLALACLESALGKDFGLSKIKGFDKAGDFFVQMRGTSGLSFNYADAGAGPLQHPTLYWLATKFDRPELAAFQRLHGKGHVYDLLWYVPASEKVLAKLPTTVKFRAVEIATARTSWTNDDALFVGVKAGRNGINHDNLDLGSFVFDALGERWVIDIGPDDYNLPHYFGRMRYHYYRLRAEGHNTLVIVPGRKQPDQNVPATCKITRCEQTGRTSEIQVDLTPAYEGHGPEKVTRAFKLTPNKLTVTDTIEMIAPGEVWWFCHVGGKTKVAKDGQSATIKIGKKSVTVTLDKPGDAKFELMPAAPLPTSPDPEGQNPNTGAKLVNKAADDTNRIRTGEIPRWGEPDPAKAIHKLAIRLDSPESKNAVIRVTFEPRK